MKWWSGAQMDASINTSVLTKGSLHKEGKSDALYKLVNCVKSAKKLSYPQTTESPMLSSGWGKDAKERLQEEPWDFY